MYKLDSFLDFHDILSASTHIKLRNSTNISSVSSIVWMLQTLTFLHYFYVASTWEIRTLNTTAGDAKCLVTHMLEVDSKVWRGWKKNQRSKFEKTVPYALLSQVAGW